MIHIRSRYKSLSYGNNHYSILASQYPYIYNQRSSTAAAAVRETADKVMRKKNSVHSSSSILLDLFSRVDVAQRSAARSQRVCKLHGRKKTKKNEKKKRKRKYIAFI